jgi:hypothetical protein
MAISHSEMQPSVVSVCPIVSLSHVAEMICLAYRFAHLAVHKLQILGPDDCDTVGYWGLHNGALPLGMEPCVLQHGSHSV